MKTKSTCPKMLRKILLNIVNTNTKIHVSDFPSLENKKLSLLLHPIRFKAKKMLLFRTVGRVENDLFLDEDALCQIKL